MSIPPKPPLFDPALRRPTSTSVDDCHPTLREVLPKVLDALRAEGFDPTIYETYRAPERGEYLRHVGASLNGAGSTHCFQVAGTRMARAADLIDGRKGPDGRIVAWGDSHPDVPPAQARERAAMGRAFFDALGRIAQAHGLVWGGSWRMFPDRCHVELHKDGRKATGGPS